MCFSFKRMSAMGWENLESVMDQLCQCQGLCWLYQAREKDLNASSPKWKLCWCYMIGIYLSARLSKSMAPKYMVYYISHTRETCNMQDMLARASCPSQNDSLQTVGRGPMTVLISVFWDPWLACIGSACWEWTLIQHWWWPKMNEWALKSEDLQ